MRILHISTRLILGGSQENTVLSCEGQARLGHDVHLAYGPIYGPEGSMLERVGAFKTDDGRSITTHEVPDMIRAIHPLREYRCQRQLIKLIEKIRPDIVHTHSSKAGIIGRAAGWKVGRRAGDHRPAVVHTIHGPPFHKYQSKIKNRIYVASERFAAKRCHTIVSVADAMTEQYLARTIGRPEQYVTVRSGMEVETFLEPALGEDRDSMRRELGIDGNDYVIGTVARLAELKGHDDLLDALGDELRARDNWKLLWVGDGWWRGRLLKRVEDMGLKDKVIATGLVPPERVPAMIRAMDVLAHPSYREGLPRTVPQALLCGVAPIAYDVDGTGEACRTGETGVLVEPGDLGALRDAVVRLFDDPQERTRLANTGRDECSTTFSARTMVDQLEKVYERALSVASERTS